MLKSKGDVLILLWIRHAGSRGPTLFAQRFPPIGISRGSRCYSSLLGRLWPALLTLACYVGMALLFQMTSSPGKLPSVCRQLQLAFAGEWSFSSAVRGDPLAAFDYDVNVSLIIQISVALLFIFIGNMTVQAITFVGIRTPWTWPTKKYGAAPTGGWRLWVIAGSSV